MSVFGESRVEPTGVTVVIPRGVADALGLTEGEMVDVDFFENTEEFLEAYDADVNFIAITTR